MKRKSEEVEEIEEIDAEEAEQALKKEKRKEGVEKRKNAKKRDKVARWGGLILLGLIIFVGFLLWVSGEMSQESQQNNIPTSQHTTVPINAGTGSVIVR